MGREKDKVAVRTQVLCIISVAQSGFRVGYHARKTSRCSAMFRNGGITFA
jgi:hypothetical protein